MENLFIPPSEIRGDGFGWLQLGFLLAAYGYLLFRASAAIADGSELLCLVLSPGLVGGLILPVLGAVPDGAIVLFSGLGPDAQEQLSVGVGALAGSTIMLLTVPWAACAVVGRVELADGGARAVYAPRGGAPKLGPWRGLAHALFSTGVGTPASLRPAALAMAGTAVTYALIQGPAAALRGDGGVAGAERPWALAAALAALAAFGGYSYWSVASAASSAAQEARIALARRTAIGTKLLSIATLIALEAEEDEAAGGGGGGAGAGGAEGGGAAPGGAVSSAALRALFARHDVDKSGSLDAGETRAMLGALGLRVGRRELGELMADVGGEDKLIQFSEFEALARSAAAAHHAAAAAAAADGGGAGGAGAGGGHVPLLLSVTGGGGGEGGKGGAAAGDDEEDEDEDEEEEEEDEAAGLTPAQIRAKALLTLAVGVGVVTLFSDPMCDVLSEVGKRAGIKPFYVSFVIAPFVSNASEMISSLAQAARKTPAGAEVTYAQLLGAATMNNTFCLAIFLALVYARGLVWEFAAETTSILAVQACILALVLSLRGGPMPLWKGALALGLYPASLLLVYVLENYVGLD